MIPSVSAGYIPAAQVAQILLAALILAQQGLRFDSHGADLLLTYAVAATTLVSGGAYVARWGWRIAHIEAP